jgi:hypothetical protein
MPSTKTNSLGHLLIGARVQTLKERFAETLPEKIEQVKKLRK